MVRYDHKKIERKWRQRWAMDENDSALDFDSRPKFYCLVEFPYPSGEGLHVGHLRSYTALDIVARKRRMEGGNVLFPIGFDAFGLPAENYAVKTKTHPAKTTAQNIKNFTRQLKAVGLSFDWDRQVVTTDPAYYRWTQWIFLQLYRRGLAYRAEIPINWCPHCKIGLANEEVVNGRCERCDHLTTKRTKAQWLLKITAYADRLIDDLALVDYPERVKLSQSNWIGRSQGATIKFQISNFKFQIEVFTTRPDTLFGATFMVVAPEHPLISNFKFQIENWSAVERYVEAAKRKSDAERTDLTREKTGVELKGIAAVNPATGKKVPVWVADYVLSTYGTGAIMAVPAHDQRDFEFAKQYHLPIIPVIKPAGAHSNTPVQSDAYEGTAGVLINSGEFNGLSVTDAIPKITAWLEYQGCGRQAVNYKLRDWVFSRQRYWGEPIPLVYCHSDECRQRRTESGKNTPGVHWVVISGREYSVVPLDEKDLPLTLPKVSKYQPTDTGESPLAAVKKWVHTTCPRCHGPALRETDVMPNWAGSNWYFLRYCDPRNSQVLADQKKLEYWMGAKSPSAKASGDNPLRGGVDWYNGGMEHTTLHLLYSRFIYKFLWDIGAVPKVCGPEPYRKRTSHGLILGQGGEKMSKSRGNVVNPDAIIAEYGADVLRLYEMFIGPFDQAAPWDTRGIVGIRRFVDSVVQYVDWWIKNEKKMSAAKMPDVEVSLQHAIGKIGEDIERMRFNTAVSELMIFRNVMSKLQRADGASDDKAAVPISREYLETYLALLAPLAPHLASELWERIGHKPCAKSHAEGVLSQPWPHFDSTRARTATVVVVVQVDGKVRGKLSIPAESSQDTVVMQAKALPGVARYLAGVAAPRVVYVKGRLINFVTR